MYAETLQQGLSPTTGTDSRGSAGPSTADKALNQMEAGSASVGSFFSSSYKQVTAAGQGIGTSVGIGMQQYVTPCSALCCDSLSMLTEHNTSPHN